MFCLAVYCDFLSYVDFSHEQLLSELLNIKRLVASEQQIAIMYYKLSAARQNNDRVSVEIEETMLQPQQVWGN